MSDTNEGLGFVTLVILIGVLYVLFSAVRQSLNLDTGNPAVDLLGPLAGAIAATFLIFVGYYMFAD